jgi:hypothetical protein
MSWGFEASLHFSPCCISQHTVNRLHITTCALTPSALFHVPVYSYTTTTTTTTQAYRDFLLEVIRRQKYTEEFEKLVTESVAKITDFRNLETEYEHYYHLLPCTIMHYSHPVKLTSCTC